MPARSAPLPRTPAPAPAEALAKLPPVQSALGWLGGNLSAINDEHVHLSAIPAPPFQESQRADALKSALSAAGLLVHVDDAGNVIGELPGADRNELVVLSAHLDTVFPPGTSVSVRREGQRMFGPGISDNGAGLAALVAIARAFHAARLQPRGTILFVANVGEEGEGNLRGMRAVVDAYGEKLKAVLVLDGAGIEHVTSQALASRRIEVIVTGPGGHSWSDFGMPNPINALVRASVRFISTRVPSSPRTTFNIGEIHGGTSVNSIPHEAHMKVDLRSESEDELIRLEIALRECLAAGIRDESLATPHYSGPKLESRMVSLGSRPGGEARPGSPLLAALRSADEFLGNASRIERSSTDANIPLSKGIDAISIGAGGAGGGAHSLGEWYDPQGRETGLKRVLLTLLGVAGVVPEKTK